MVEDNINSFSEFELAEDVIQFVEENKDVNFEDNTLRDKLFSYAQAPSVLLKVTKTINSPTTIVDIQQVDDEYITENF